MVRVGFPPGSHPRVPGPPMRISMDGTTFHKAKLLLERCESGRIGFTANELTWVTGSEGSNPSLSARGAGMTKCPNQEMSAPADTPCPATVAAPAGCEENEWSRVGTGCRLWGAPRTRLTRTSWRDVWRVRGTAAPPLPPRPTWW